VIRRRGRICGLVSYIGETNNEIISHIIHASFKLTIDVVASVPDVVPTVVPDVVPTVVVLPVPVVVA